MFRRIKISLATLLAVVTIAGALAACTPNSPGGSLPSIPSIIPSAPSQATGLDTIQEAWKILNREYVEPGRINTANLTQSAIRGMIDALDDPYTSYMNPQAYELSKSEMSGEFEGIGAFVAMRDGQLIITAPMPDSPAAKAGILPGDAVLEVDGKPTSEMSLEEAVLHIRGPRGTTVSLLIQHPDKPEPEIIMIVRASIQVPTVTSEMKGDIAYIRIFHFAERTDEELSNILAKNSAANTTGIILDLRSNPGGFVDIVVDVASHFIKSGDVLHIVDNKGNKETLSVHRTSFTTDLPMVALSDNFSASGSEVLMGALQDHKRATIAGTVTYGKGSVNQFFSLPDGSGLYVTIARWLTPNGRAIEHKGIDPDIQLELDGDEAIDWAINYLKDKQK